jgi:hypothetical protein
MGPLSSEVAAWYAAAGLFGMESKRTITGRILTQISYLKLNLESCLIFTMMKKKLLLACLNNNANHHPTPRLRRRAVLA